MQFSIVTGRKVGSSIRSLNPQLLKFARSHEIGFSVVFQPRSVQQRAQDCRTIGLPKVGDGEALIKDIISRACLLALRRVGQVNTVSRTGETCELLRAIVAVEDAFVRSPTRDVNEFAAVGRQLDLQSIMAILEKERDAAEVAVCCDAGRVGECVLPYGWIVG